MNDPVDTRRKGARNQVKAAQAAAATAAQEKENKAVPRLASERSPAAAAAAPEPKQPRSSPSLAAKALFPASKPATAGKPAVKLARSPTDDEEAARAFASPDAEGCEVPAKYLLSQEARICYKRGLADGRAGKLFKDVYCEKAYPDKEAFSDGYDEGLRIREAKNEKAVTPPITEARFPSKQFEHVLACRERRPPQWGKPAAATIIT